MEATIERDLRLAEEGVEKLADALGISEAGIVEILRDGLGLNIEYHNEYHDTIFEELEATFFD